ncbi:cell division topological specificity factor MinE [Phormidium tenue FACHB-886]|nr:cell division topological specificity factor MinE [Phormidium tenue FACHB-886]
MLQELIDRLFSRGTSQKTSRETVKHRLKILLAHDRTDLSPAMVERMRQEIIEVVSRYVEIDTDGAEFLLESDQRSTALIANLPIRGIKSEALAESPSDAAASQAASSLASPEPPKSSNPATAIADSPEQPAETAAPRSPSDDLSPDLDLWLDAIEAPVNANKPLQSPDEIPDQPSSNRQPPAPL